MQPILMDPDQVRIGIEGAQDNNLAVVFELPHGELVVNNANDLKRYGRHQYQLGEAIIIDINHVRHIRAVDSSEIEKTFAELHARH
jgi:hypothetical protein